MAKSFTLPNGLSVVFEERHTAQVVASQVWMRAGSADERPDQAGLAHLHEHMLFRGTARRGVGEIAREVETHGGQINAWTSHDQTVSHVEIASRFTRLSLDILADAAKMSSFEEEEVAREIEVICEEIRRNEDAPSRRAARDLFATAFQQHPYGRLVSGTIESVRRLRRADVLEFHQRHCAPPNLVLCVAGDFREAELRGWVEELFSGDWGAPPPLGPSTRPVEPPLTSRRLLLRQEAVKGAWLNLGFPIPNIAHPDTPALDALAMMAGLGERSGSASAPKRQRGLVNMVQASSYTPRDPGLFSVAFTMQPESMAEALESEAQRLASLYAGLASSEELSHLKALFESRAVYQRETVQALARRLGYYQCMLGELDAEARYQDAVAQLTPERVREVAERYVRLDRAILTGLLPSGTDFSAARAEEILDRAARPLPPSGPARPPHPAPVAEPRARVARAPHAASGAVVEERLPSGMRVLVLEEPPVPLVACCALVQGGLRYEAADTNGLSTLLSRCLTRGTLTRDTDTLTQRMESFGGSLRGVGGRNTMGLRGMALSRHFEGAFRLFADCLLNPLFPEPEVARERRMLEQEIRARDNNPAALVFDLFARTLYQTHAYRLPQLGEPAAIERLTPESLRAWHEAYLAPARVTLCVVGDVKAESVLALSHELFGGVESAAAPPRAVEQEPPRAAPRYQKRALACAQSHLVLGFQGARVNDPWRYALSVLSTLLGGKGGRLFRELREERGLAYSVSSLNLEGVDPGSFGVYLGTSPEKVDAAVAGVRALLEQVREERLPEQELARGRQHLLGTHAIALQRNAARADALAMGACQGIGAEDLLNYADRVGAVTAEEVRDVAQRVIDFDRSALAVVGP